MVERYTIPDDLRPWVVAMLPKLTDEDWPALCEWCVAGCPYWNTSMFLDLPSGIRVTPDEAQALIAGLDEIAAGIAGSDGHVFPMDRRSDGVKATEPTCALCGAYGPDGPLGVCPEKDGSLSRAVAWRLGVACG